MSVYKKILQVQSMLKPVPKSGTLVVNGKKQYDFAQESDVLITVNEAAIACGLLIMTSMESSEIGYFEVTNQYGSSTRRWAKVRMRFDIVDVEDDNPEEPVMSWMDGYAEDTGDKPLTKAITSATKYFMLKFFRLPTGDDLEADPTTHEATTRSKAQTAQKPSYDPPIEDPKISCLRSYDAIVALAKKNGWTQAQVQAFTGIESCQAVMKQGTLAAAETLGKAYLSLLNAERTGAE